LHQLVLLLRLPCLQQRFLPWLLAFSSLLSCLKPLQLDLFSVLLHLPRLTALPSLLPAAAALLALWAWCSYILAPMQQLGLF
jgi:hypothetical protein